MRYEPVSKKTIAYPDSSGAYILGIVRSVTWFLIVWWYFTRDSCRFQAGFCVFKVSIQYGAVNKTQAEVCLIVYIFLHSE